MKQWMLSEECICYHRFANASLCLGMTTCHRLRLKMTVWKKSNDPLTINHILCTDIHTLAIPVPWHQQNTLAAKGGKIWLCVPLRCTSSLDKSNPMVKYISSAQICARPRAKPSLAREDVVYRLFSGSKSGRKMIELTELTAMHPQRLVSRVETKPFGALSSCEAKRFCNCTTGRRFRSLLRTASHVRTALPMQQLLVFQNFAAARHGETTRNDERPRVISRSERTAVSCESTGIWHTGHCLVKQNERSFNSWISTQCQSGHLKIGPQLCVVLRPPLGHPG